MAVEAPAATPPRVAGGRFVSEVRPLRLVLRHSPGGRLSRLTPGNRHALLFDDLPWLDRARDEHDEFASVLRDRGAEVMYLQDLLADVLRVAPVGDELIAAALDPARLGAT